MGQKWKMVKFSGNFFLLLLTPYVIYHSIENKILNLSCKFHGVRMILTKKIAKKRILAKFGKIRKNRFFVSFFAIFF
jgi:hypothetical protein